MNKLVSFVAFGLLLLTACSNENVEKSKSIVDNSDDLLEDLTVEEIIDSVYYKYGSEEINSSNIYFEFRDFKYAYEQDQAGVKRSRKFTNDKGEEVYDVWQGNDLARTINGKQVQLTEKDEKAYINSINSVFYFAFLPKALKDPAVNTELIDEVEIKGKMYYKIKVTFDEQGGGDDFHDIFLYWIGIEDYSMDYFAYQYFTEGGGVRFREVIGKREVGGICFQAYNNYGPKENIMDRYEEVDAIFIENGLELVSEIKLENIRVE
ncbi:MAG TPA: DUF6503 family protein [Brumimicrobium sp.]|nr:DUF6503 family protein [Brumimicrobium sp.]